MEKTYKGYYERKKEKERPATLEELKGLDNFTGYICVCYDKDGTEIPQVCCDEKLSKACPIYTCPIDAIPHIVREEVKTIAVYKCIGLPDPQVTTRKKVEDLSESYSGNVERTRRETPVYHYTETGEKPHIPGFPFYYEKRLSAVEILINGRGTMTDEAKKLLENQLFIKSYKGEMDEVKWFLQSGRYASKTKIYTAKTIQG